MRNIIFLILIILLCCSSRLSGGSFRAGEYSQQVYTGINNYLFFDDDNYFESVTFIKNDTFCNRICLGKWKKCKNDIIIYYDTIVSYLDKNHQFIDKQPDTLRIAEYGAIIDKSKNIFKKSSCKSESPFHRSDTNYSMYYNGSGTELYIEPDGSLLVSQRRVGRYTGKINKDNDLIIISLDSVPEADALVKVLSAKKSIHDNDTLKQIGRRFLVNRGTIFRLIKNQCHQTGH